MYVVTQAHIQNTLKIEFGNRENEEVEANEKNNWFRIEQLQPEERNKKILKLLRFIAPFLTFRDGNNICKNWGSSKSNSRTNPRIIIITDRFSTTLGGGKLLHPLLHHAHILYREKSDAWLWPPFPVLSTEAGERERGHYKALQRVLLTSVSNPRAARK